MSAEIIRFVVDAAGRLAPWAVQILLQSTLLLGAGLLVARLGRRQGPALESVVLRTTLVMVLAGPFVSIALTRAGLPMRHWEMPRAGVVEVAANLPGAAVPATDGSAETSASDSTARERMPSTAAAVAPSTKTSSTAVEPVSPPVAAQPFRSDASAEPAQPWRALSPVVPVVAWAIIGGLLLLRLAVAHRRIARLLRDSDLAAVSVFENCTAIARELAIPAPEVRVHPGLNSPLLIGWLRPAILLPDVKGLEDIVATREVFLHELAHRVRHDCFWHLLTRTVVAVFWIQPLLWILARRIEETAEDVCDNYVIEHSRDRRAYAELLVALAEQLQYSPAEALAGTGVIAFRSALGQRVVRILDVSRNLSVRAGDARWGSAATLLLATIGIGLLGVRAAESAGVTSGQRITILAAGSQQFAAGVLAPDESAIAYLGEWNSLGADIEVRDLQSGRAQKVTHGAAGQTYVPEEPIWSPDSKRLAYWWWQDVGGMSVRIVPREGGAARSVNLTWDKSQPNARSDGASFRPLDWSRDGQLLVGEWTLQDHSRVLATLTLATGEIRVLGSGTLKAAHPRFSPDGRMIVFERTVDGNRDIYLASVDGARILRVTSSPAEDGSPIFSADGRHVLYSSNQRGLWDLWAVAIGREQLAGAPFIAKVGFGDNAKRVTASGKLAFTAQSGSTDIVAFDVTDARSAPQPLANGSFGRNRHAVWSPDGKKIAFGRTTGEERPWEVCIQSAMDGREESYRTGMRIPDWIFWSPDGRTLALGGEHEDGVVGMYLYSLDARDPVRKRFSGLGSQPLGFSADGTEFLSFNKANGLFATHLRTGDHRSVATADLFVDAYQPGTRVNGFALAPDGKHVVVVEGDKEAQQLVVKTLDGRRQSVLARAAAPASLRSPSFSPDGAKIAYFVGSETEEAPQELRVVSVDGADNRLLHQGEFWHLKIPPRWSPDGSRVTGTLSSRAVAEVGVLENFLPGEKNARR